MSLLIDEDWTYTGDPESNSVDRVRDLVGDTDENEPLVSDSAIKLALKEHSNFNLAAADVAETIAARFARLVDKVGKDFSEQFSSKYDHYKQLASFLRTKSEAVVPQAAQTRHSTREQFTKDKDIARGAFSVGMFHDAEFDPRTRDSFRKDEEHH